MTVLCHVLAGTMLREPNSGANHIEIDVLQITLFLLLSCCCCELRLTVLSKY